MNEHEIVTEWLCYARNDLVVAKHCIEDLHPKQTEIASYHCQQCAEKALKAFLISKNIEPPKIHDLKVLCKMCQDIDTSFSGIASQCAHLTPYGVTVRYPDELSPNEDMVKRAIDEAQQVYDLTIAHCMEKQPIPIYQFYAELEGYKPKIWRRFQVEGNISVAQLGYIVMTMYEMKAEHLLAIEHERSCLTPSGNVNRRNELLARYAIPDKEGEWRADNPDNKDATKTKLFGMDLEAPAYLVVWYDFGDDWRVSVTLETILNDSGLSAKEFPKVIDGKGFGIIEDCGGVYGLEGLIQAFKDKEGVEYEECCECLGVDDFDMTMFDLDDMNFRVKKIPAIYAKIYEQEKTPSHKEINLLERNYKKKK